MASWFLSWPVRRRQPSEAATFLSPEVQQKQQGERRRGQGGLEQDPAVMYNVGEIKKKRPAYLPDFIICAVLRAPSVTHRVRGRRVSESTGLAVQELVLTSSAHLRGVETLKK